MQNNKNTNSDFLEGKEIIDKGTYVIENENDKQILTKYIYELAHGNQYYKPVGLKKNK